MAGTQKDVPDPPARPGFCLYHQRTYHDARFPRRGGRDGRRFPGVDGERHGFPDLHRTGDRRRHRGFPGERAGRHRRDSAGHRGSDGGLFPHRAGAEQRDVRRGGRGCASAVSGRGTAGDRIRGQLYADDVHLLYSVFCFQRDFQYLPEPGGHPVQPFPDHCDQRGPPDSQPAVHQCFQYGRTGVRTFVYRGQDDRHGSGPALDPEGAQYIRRPFFRVLPLQPEGDKGTVFPGHAADGGIPASAGRNAACQYISGPAEYDGDGSARTGQFHSESLQHNGRRTDGDDGNYLRPVFRRREDGPDAPVREKPDPGRTDRHGIDFADSLSADAAADSPV